MPRRPRLTLWRSLSCRQQSNQSGRPLSALDIQSSPRRSLVSRKAFVFSLGGKATQGWKWTLLVRVRLFAIGQYRTSRRKLVRVIRPQLVLKNRV